MSTSEISEYLFCRRSWHLSAQGVRPSLVQIERMRDGLAQHRAHARLVKLSHRLTSAAYVVIFVLMIVAGYWLWIHSH